MRIFAQSHVPLEMTREWQVAYWLKEAINNSNYTVENNKNSKSLYFPILASWFVCERTSSKWCVDETRAACITINWRPKTVWKVMRTLNLIFASVNYYYFYVPMLNQIYRIVFFFVSSFSVWFISARVKKSRSQSFSLSLFLTVTCKYKYQQYTK